MSYILTVNKEARLDMLEAYWYYEQKQPLLGERFFQELHKRFDAISGHPQYFGYIDSRHILREARVNNFPFVVIYEIKGEEVIVYSVHSTHKHQKNKYLR